MTRQEPVPKVLIDGVSYWYEHGTYRTDRAKLRSAGKSIDQTRQQVEGGFVPRTWRMNLICESKSKRDSIETSYEKTDYSNRAVTFQDNEEESHEVYITDLGPVQNIDRRITLFRIPIVLEESTIV